MGGGMRLDHCQHDHALPPLASLRSHSFCKKEWERGRKKGIFFRGGERRAKRALRTDLSACGHAQAEEFSGIASFLAARKEAIPFAPS